VRELQNCIERAVILCDGPEIRPEHLRLQPDLREAPRIADAVDLSGTLAEVRERAASLAEREAIAQALRESGGDRAAAAERLGVSLSTLGRRLRDHPPGADDAVGAGPDDVVSR
jgi:DNA-binding NtrC family response regulator